MKTVIDKMNLAPFTARTFTEYFGGKKLAVFDIETTGLNPAYCKVILSGIMLIGGGERGEECQVIQYFANEPDDEKEILEKTNELLKDVDVILTYNGKHFDLPFMEKRAKKHGMTFDAPYNLDLYLVVNGHSCLKEVLPNLKQKSVEVFMGLADSRDDEISGGESVALYNRYMTTKTFELERKILLHNHDDLIQLYQLLPVILKTDFHRAMFKLGFPAGNAVIEKITQQGRDLHVLGTQIVRPENPAKDYISFPTEEQPYSLIMDSASRQMELIVPCQVQAGSIYFDAQQILGERVTENSLYQYPGVAGGYLITSELGNINYMEINAFLLEFFRQKV